MLIACNNYGQRAQAQRAIKQDAPFTCPSCNSPVTLKQGAIVVHHFAHKPGAECAYGQGETRAHMEAKLGIYELFSQNRKVTKVELEWTLADGCRADVYAELDGAKLAVELQRSQQSESETDRRTKRYNDLGVAVLWVAVPDIAKIVGPGRGWRHQHFTYVDEYRPTAMEKYFSALHLGTYFLWRSDTKTLHKAKLERVDRYVDSNEYGGGYITKYKDRRDMCLSQPLGASLGARVQLVKRWKHFPERLVAVSTSFQT